MTLQSVKTADDWGRKFAWQAFPIRGMWEGVILIFRQPEEIITDKGLNWVKSKKTQQNQEN